jgi:hypothetical protein
MKQISLWSLDGGGLMDDEDFSVVAIVLSLTTDVALVARFL